jgi:hypothetical protein
MWTEIALVCGVIAVTAYALIAAVELPLAAAVIVACVFGSALAAASGGQLAAREAMCSGAKSSDREGGGTRAW